MEKSIEDFFEACKALRVLVVGDLMVDRYLWGKVSRISPEAPVPIVDVYREENRLGGAANVALNVRAMGATPILGGLVGTDRDGVVCRQLAVEQAFQTDLILPSETRRTTVKVRVIGNQQQVLRVDKEEDTFSLTEEEENTLLPALLQHMPSCDLVLLEDYDKGLFSPSFIKSLVAEAKKNCIPIFVDPKFRNFLSYAGVHLFKPNLKELNEGLKIQVTNKEHQAIQEAVWELRSVMPHSFSLITLSENGVLLVDEKGEGHHFPAHYRDIIDVSGAGDTVITVASLAMAAGLSPRLSYPTC